MAKWDVDVSWSIPACATLEVEAASAAEAVARIKAEVEAGKEHESLTVEDIVLSVYEGIRDAGSGGVVDSFWDAWPGSVMVEATEAATGDEG